MEVKNKIIVNRTGKLSLALAAAMGLSLLGAATAAGQMDSTTQPSVAVAANPSDALTLTLEPGRAHKVTTPNRIKKANILNPDIADVVVLDPTELLVTGKKPGVTQLIIWDENDQTKIMDIVVSSNIETLRRELKSLFPTANITADDDNGSITLHGQVRTLQLARQAEEISAPYTSNGGKVHNLLEVGGGQQVMLEVKFAEVSKDVTKELGINFGGSDGTSFAANNIGLGQFGTVEAANFTQVLASASPASTIALFGQGAVGKTVFQYFLEALEKDNLVRLLAEPNLVTTSGQKASFLAGGSIPIPVPQSSSGGGTVITIEYKQYGVQLNFTPVVLGDGRVRLEVNPDVSELDYSHAVNVGAGQPVPGITERSVNTTVEMAEGQTFALAGLLQDNVNATDSQIPLLGDIPVLGALFRSVRYERKETELVVMVTPHLVHAMDPGGS